MDIPPAFADTPQYPNEDFYTLRDREKALALFSEQKDRLNYNNITAPNLILCCYIDEVNIAFYMELIFRKQEESMETIHEGIFYSSKIRRSIFALLSRADMREIFSYYKSPVLDYYYEWRETGKFTISEEYVLTCPFYTSVDIVNLYHEYRYLVLTRPDVDDDTVYEYFYDNIFYLKRELDKYKDKIDPEVYQIALERNEIWKNYDDIPDDEEDDD